LLFSIFDTLTLLVLLLLSFNFFSLVWVMEGERSLALEEVLGGEAEVPQPEATAIGSLSEGDYSD
jgi:hypothetical protein